ncbi:hypothetical protein LWV33_03155 [Brucella intermedia]
MDKVLFPLSQNFRLASDGIQWIVERRVGDGERFIPISFHRHKEGLLFRLFSKTRPIDIDAAALPLIAALRATA